MEKFDSYDPLTVENDDTGWVLAARKREIGNILKSYTGYYDPFAELLQNALDAVEKRAYEEDENYSPKIWLTINMQKKTISVTDNGIGMSSTEFQMFLKPNYSFKTGERSRGMKGVGATYIAYGFNDLRVSTRKNNTIWSGRITDGRRWVEDKSGVIGVPMFIPSEPYHSYFEEIDNGTSVTISLTGDNIRPKDLGYNGASTAKQWVALLKVNTPLGAIYILTLRSEPNRL